MSDFAAGAPGAAPRSKMLVGGLVLVLALALFGAAFVYAGGIDIVTKLIDGGGSAVAVSPTPPAKTNQPATSGSAAAAGAGIPSGVMEDFGKRMYLEQIESQKNIRLLAEGKITSFKVDSVTPASDRTIVNITVTFKDGTKAPGGLVLKQDNKQYYVFEMVGLRVGSTGGDADSVTSGGSVNENSSIADEMKDAGVKSFDQPLLATLLSEQKSNQAIITGIVDGTYTGVTLAAPVQGAGTITIAAELTGKQSAKGQVTLLKKTVDGKAYTFISSFKKQ